MGIILNNNKITTVSKINNAKRMVKVWKKDGGGAFWPVILMDGTTPKMNVMDIENLTVLSSIGANELAFTPIIVNTYTGGIVIGCAGVVTSGGNIRVYLIENNELIYQSTLPSLSTQTICFAFNGTYLYSVFNFNALQHYTMTGTNPLTFSYTGGIAITAVAKCIDTSTDNTMLTIAGGAFPNPNISVYDINPLTGGLNLKATLPILDSATEVNAIKWLDNTYIAAMVRKPAISNNNAFIIYKVGSTTISEIYVSPRRQDAFNRPQNIGCNSNGTIIVSGSSQITAGTTVLAAYKLNKSDDSVTDITANIDVQPSAVVNCVVFIRDNLLVVGTNAPNFLFYQVSGDDFTLVDTYTALGSGLCATRLVPI